MFTRNANRKSAGASEEGSALIGVVGLVAVAGLLVAVVTASTVQAMGQTSATRAGVQSQAAADAGVEFARALIEADECIPEIDRSYGDIYSAGELSDLGLVPGKPFFDATVQYQVVPANTWTIGCPNDLVDDSLEYRVRIESTGYAQSPGVADVSAQDEHTVEAVFAWDIYIPTEEQQPETSIEPSGPAVYAYSSSGFGGGGVLYSVDGTGPDVLVKTGNVVCNGGSEGVSDLVVDGGTLRIDGGCDLDGNAWSSGRTTVSGGATIGGNVIAAGITHGGTLIGGSVWSTSDVVINGGGTIGGTATAASLSVTNGTLRGAGWINGASTFNWGGYIYANVTTRSSSKPGNWDGQRNGARVIDVPSGPGPSPFPTPQRPLVPPWVDFTYDPADWAGFTALTHSGTTCTYEQLQAKVNSLGGAPGVIDARGCSNGIVINGAQKLAIANDVAIIANKFSLTAGGGVRSSADARLWLITPDAGATPNARPDCAATNSFTINGDFDFSPSISTMIYSPCKVDVGSGIDTLRGQLFVGATTIDGGANIGFSAVGLPGVDLSTGDTSDTGGGPIIIELPGVGSLGDLGYYRDIPESTVG